MNNYSDMDLYMPEDFEYLNRLYNFGMPNNMQNQGQGNGMTQNNIMMPKQGGMNQMMQNQNNTMEDKMLQQKLSKQAGDTIINKLILMKFMMYTVDLFAEICSQIYIIHIKTVNHLKFSQ